MADAPFSARICAAVRTFRAPGKGGPAHPTPSSKALDRLVTDVVASQAVFEVVGWHLQGVADAGRDPTAREQLAHMHATAQVARSIDRLALGFADATKDGGAP